MVKTDFDFLDLFFRHKSLVRQHIDSFNYFIEHEIKEIVMANNIVESDIDHSFYFKYTSIKVGKPTISENMVEQDVFPQECRIRDLTYAANIYVDIEYIKNKKIIVKKNVFLGKMPIMLRSKYCNLTNFTGTDQGKIIDYQAKECFYDNGGYFIIRGAEKVIQIQEQLSKNRIIIETGKVGMFASVTSASIKHKSKTIVYSKKGVFYAQSNMFVEDVPVILLIKSFGIENDKELANLIGNDALDMFEINFEYLEKNKICTQDDAIEKLSKFVKTMPDESAFKITKNALFEKILPNVDVSENLRPKGICVCLMVRRLILAKKQKIEPDDKDYLGNKRFELAGQLLSILFEDTFKKFNFELQKAIDKILSKRIRTNEFDALTFFNLQTGMVTTALNRSISSGNWSLKRFKMERSGITHVVTRYSYITALGMMTKINSHFEKTRKVSGPRALHTSAWGMMCPSDTPEGEGCGLVKNLALLSEITTECTAEDLRTLFKGLEVEKYSSSTNLYAENTYMVFVNGNLHGSVENPREFCEKLREKRRTGYVNKYVSVFCNKYEKTIFISTDNGRICRPLIILQKNSMFYDNYKIKYDVIYAKSFNDLIEMGFIEYVDVSEENNCVIALMKQYKSNEDMSKYTHLEISDACLLSLVAGLVPFPHHNQSPRNTYQCAMGKQAIGTIGVNLKSRCDSLFLHMTYTQKPMSFSKVLRHNKYNNIPSGFNGMVAVMSYSGYDIEDAIVLNKNSLDKGMARVEVYRTVKIDLERSLMGRPEEIHVVDGVEQIVSIGTHVKEGSMLVTKINPNTGMLNIVKHKGYDAYVDRIFYTKGDDDKMIKIVLREVRVPEVGDKFSSRHGQKGVVGMIAANCDLPFNEQGLVPDIIMNPHGFPSRMTVGKILEQITGKAAVCIGEHADATAFEDNTMVNGKETLTEVACQKLIDNGFSYSGKDVFTSGITGKQIEAYVFYGPIFYQRLKHMVADKIHCRARGPRAVLTRQPTEGRSKDGGLRLGEMERDCLIGYGASAILNERLMHCSDEFVAFVCKKCGVICYHVKCNICNLAPVNVKMPYACKLLFQELMAMNILPVIRLKNNDYYEQ
ncbi:RET1 [Ecytonucleospora hepatopenaei]|uniref:DNA-directed RNA polymerase subunit beta n=1 Tax=Ecytonucleospora hepatopenaei TaxID=646526 RepID=A0A1W0E6Z8_9MICR|nr:RET1 [Ecytonucleospora hepatopenaei]